MIPTSIWPKLCGCGCSYTEHEWSMLMLIGRMKDEVEDIELRNCTCGSTIAQLNESWIAHSRNDNEMPSE